MAGRRFPLAHALGDERKRITTLAHRIFGPGRRHFQPERLVPAPRAHAPPRSILAGPQQKRHRPSDRNQQHEKREMHRHGEREYREAEQQQHPFRGALPARSRTFAIRVEPRGQRVVPVLQALEQIFVRTGAGVDERETSGVARFEPAQPVECVNDRAGGRARDLRARAGSCRTQLRSGNDSFDLEVGAPGTQRTQPLLVAAKLKELRSFGRGTGRSCAPVSFVAHRMERPASVVAYPESVIQHHFTP